MSLNPLVIIFALSIIAIGVYIRFKKHPLIPVIALFSLAALAILIGCLFTIDSAILPTELTDNDFLIKLVIWNYKQADLNTLYKAFDLLKDIVIFLLLATQLSLLIETGLIIRHKKERN